jgi:hypothetical protein
MAPVRVPGDGPGAPRRRLEAGAALGAHRGVRGAELAPLGADPGYGWLAANATRFHFTQRYSCEPWHYETS